MALLGIVSGQSRVGEMFEKIRNGSSFILLKTRHQNGYDNDNYYGLGKFGKQFFGKENVFGAVFGEEVVDDLKNIGVSSADLVDDGFWEKVKGSYYRGIVGRLHKSREEDTVIEH